MRWARRIFATAWLLIVLYTVLAGLVVLYGVITGTVPEDGIWATGPGYPVVTPPAFMISTAATLLLAQSIWTIPLHLDDSPLTHRLIHAAITLPLLFILVASAGWVDSSTNESAMTAIFTATAALITGASVLFGLRWFLEFINLVPKKWRTPNAY